MIVVCKTKTAANPYTFLNTKIQVYSYEELCYYIFNNMVLVGRDDLESRLSEWVRNELEMPELADRIDLMLEKNVYLQDMMLEILTYGDYYGSDEIKEFMAECKRVRTLKPYELDKKRADSYMMYRHYIKAVTIYDDIIYYKESQGEYDDFLGNIYHNKGVALAGNLQLEEAKDCFIRAFSLNKNNESLIEYFYVMAVTVDTATMQRELRKRGMPAGFLDDLMSEIGDSKEDVHEMSIYNKVQKAVYNRMKGDFEDYDKRMDSILGSLKDEFRNQIG